MSSSSNAIQEIDFLVDTLYEGTGASDAALQLENLILTSEAARDEYRRSVLLHVMLEAMSTRPPAVPMPLNEFAELDFSPGAVVHLAEPRPALLHRLRFSGTTVLFGVAVTLVVVGYVLSLAGLVMWDRFRASGKNQMAWDSLNEPAAVLTRGDDVSWQREFVKATRRGTPARALRVRKGKAELEFAGGARVVVEGPAEFDVLTGGSGFLHHGRLTAVVPTRAVGFTIDTPTTRIVDLGTEFAVSVEPDGASEVKVLRGAVETSRVAVGDTPSPLAKPIRLGDGEGIRIPVMQDAAVLLTRDSTGQFKLREPSFATLGSGLAAIAPIEPGEISGLRLWLRADRGVIADGDGRVERWEDQSDQHFSAAQIRESCRPQLVENRSPNPFQTVRFDGKDDYLDSFQSLGVSAETDFTFFIVFTTLHAEPISGIFSLRDQEYADWNSVGGFAFCRAATGMGLRIAQAESSGDAKGTPHAAGHDPLSFETTSGYAPADVTLVASVKKGGGTATLTINGSQVAVDRYTMKFSETPPPGGAAGYVLGARAAFSESAYGPSLAGTSRYGQCEIAEIMIYNRDLTAAEMARVNDYLTLKYLQSKPRKP